VLIRGLLGWPSSPISPTNLSPPRILPRAKTRGPWMAPLLGSGAIGPGSAAGEVRGWGAVGAELKLKTKAKLKLAVD